MSASVAPKACSLTVAVLDFEKKSEWTCPFDEAPQAMDPFTSSGSIIDATDLEEARKLLLSLKVIGEETIDDALKHEPSTQLARYDDYVHLSCRAVASAGRNSISSAST
jgi:hypothetical protein